MHEETAERAWNGWTAEDHEQHAKLLKEEADKDAAKKVPERSKLTFTMFEEELVNLNKWQEEHNKVCKWMHPDTYRGAIGGSLIYSFCYTSLGQVVKVQCHCGEIGDISDYDSW